MVEIVLTLGIIAFALLPLMGTLVLVHQSNRSAKESTELGLVMQSCNALLRNYDPAELRDQLEETPLELYFSEGGRYLGTTSSDPHLYRCTITLNANGPQSNQRIGALVRIEYPAPNYAEHFTYPIGVFDYGSKLP